jgi:hypothetical protein
MSFALTTEQVRNRTKTVTRRLGSRTAKVGELRQPVVKGMGLKKGEKVTKINGPICFTDVRPEPVDAITPEDVVREGFPGMTPAEFIEFFCRHNRCPPSTVVTRIEFTYVESAWQS